MSSDTTPETEQERLTDREQERWQELHAVPLDDLSDAETTSKLKLSLKRRYSYGEWMVVFEFGAENGRRADAIAVNTLASRNYKILGFELKASRSDWLREKNEGEKADHFVQLCDEWYVVAPKGVIQESELPEGWGYLEMKPNSEQLYKMQEANPTQYQQEGGPTRRFWTRFLKKTVGDETNYTKQDLEEARSRGYEKGKDEMRDRSTDTDYELERLREKAASWDALRDRFDALPWRELSDKDLETIDLGISIVKAIHSNRFGHLESDVEQLQRDIDRHTSDMQENVDAIKTGVETLQQRVSKTDLDDVLEGANQEGER